MAGFCVNFEAGPSLDPDSYRSVENLFIFHVLVMVKVEEES